jgi:hypothetical protein
LHLSFQPNSLVIKATTLFALILVDFLASARSRAFNAAKDFGEFRKPSR